MPTRGRREYAEDALSCFLCQTYEHRELVILDDADNPSFLGGVQIEGVQYERLKRRMSIGAKRNLCVSRSRGELIAHWDDDDFSAPERLADQVDRLGDHDVTGYNAIRFTDGARWWQYTGADDYAVGTSLLYRRDYWERHPFVDEMVGEDSAFIVPARNAGRIACVDAGAMMWASVHPGNTSQRKITNGATWREILEA